MKLCTGYIHDKERSVSTDSKSVSTFLKTMIYFPTYNNFQETKRRKLLTILSLLFHQFLNSVKTRIITYIVANHIHSLRFLLMLFNFYLSIYFVELAPELMFSDHYNLNQRKFNTNSYVTDIFPRTVPLNL